MEDKWQYFVEIYHKGHMTAQGLLSQIWTFMMDDCRQEVRLMFCNTVDALIENEQIGEELGEEWKRKVLTCPVGRDKHVGCRVWCAYCGDICADLCDTCEEWFTEWDDLEDYASIHDTLSRYGSGHGLCRSCYKMVARLGDIVHLEHERVARLAREEYNRQQMELAA